MAAANSTEGLRVLPEPEPGAHGHEPHADQVVHS
jgi:hypothetical protein